MRLCYDCGSLFSAANNACPRCGLRLKEAADPLIGAVFSEKYRLEEKLGAGGMCDVYRARHIAIGKEVAVKVLRPELAADPKVVERFEREARAASLVHHPNAITLMDYGTATGNTPFMVMELIVGATLRELLKRHGAMPVERVTGIVNQACAALEAAHSVGVIHRDIKPENILVTEYDGRDWVQVVDFGIAKIQEDVNRRAALTGANLIIGTPRYMAPEQAEERPVDARSDIYSLGVVVYEMLAGVPPFAGSTATQLLIAHAVEPPPPLMNHRPDLPPEVAAVVMRALDKDPARRPQSALDFARELERAARLARLPDSYLTQSAVPAHTGSPLAESSEAAPVEEVTMTLGDEDEETLVRRAARDTEAVAAAETAPPARRERAAAAPAAQATGGRRKRPSIVLVAGLLAMLLIGALAAYFARDNQSSGNGAAAQVDSRGARANANAALPASPTAAVESVRSEAAKPAPPADAGKAVNEVRDTVSQWNAALEARNLDAHMAFYAPRLHTYFLKGDVDRSAARAEVAGALSRYSKLKIEASPLAISVDASGDHAVVTYEKSWDFEGKTPWSGAVIERLWLDRSNGRWRISGVRDLKQVR